MSKILIIEDEAEIMELLTVIFEANGFEVFGFDNGNTALSSIDLNDIAIAVLDIMLPGMDGFEICQKIRAASTMPIIMLTARISDSDKINGLNIGADDYVTKPFNPQEVLARVKAQLRRSMNFRSDTSGNLWERNGLCVNADTHTCTVDGQPKILTPTEFAILEILCRADGSVISAKSLFEQVWKETYTSSNNAIMVHIRHLREKLGDNTRNPRFIKTVWGVGYKIETNKK